MRTAIWIAFFAVWGGVLWLLVIHPWLSRQGKLENVDNILDAYNVGWLGKLRISLSGLKRKFFSRVVWISGLMLSLHELLLPHIGLFEPIIPEHLRVYLLPTITVLGIMFEFLSKISPAPPEVVNPGALAAATGAPIEVIAAETADDPAVATVTPEIVATAKGEVPWTGLP